MFLVNTIKFSSRVMKTFNYLLVVRARENTDVFITPEIIYGIDKKE